jgi:hypothetical protein
MRRKEASSGDGNQTTAPSAVSHQSFVIQGIQGIRGSIDQDYYQYLLTFEPNKMVRELPEVDAGAILAQELNQLSLKEREELLYDIHGVLELPKE